MVILTKLQQEERIPRAQIIYNHLVTMTRTKAMTHVIMDNIWRVLEFVGVPIRMFSVNFVLEQFNCTLSVASTEGLSKDKLRTCTLIEKPIIPKKLDGK